MRRRQRTDGKRSISFSEDVVKRDYVREFEDLRAEKMVVKEEDAETFEYNPVSYLQQNIELSIDLERKKVFESKSKRHASMVDISGFHFKKNKEQFHHTRSKTFIRKCENISDKFKNMVQNSNSRSNSPDLLTVNNNNKNDELVRDIRNLSFERLSNRPNSWCAHPDNEKNADVVSKAGVSKLFENSSQCRKLSYKLSNEKSNGPMIKIDLAGSAVFNKRYTYDDDNSNSSIYSPSDYGTDSDNDQCHSDCSSLFVGSDKSPNGTIDSGLIESVMDRDKHAEEQNYYRSLDRNKRPQKVVERILVEDVDIDLQTPRPQSLNLEPVNISPNSLFQTTVKLNDLRSRSSSQLATSSDFVRFESRNRSRSHCVQSTPRYSSDENQEDEGVTVLKHCSGLDNRKNVPDLMKIHKSFATSPVPWFLQNNEALDQSPTLTRETKRKQRPRSLLDLRKPRSSSQYLNDNSMLYHDGTNGVENKNLHNFIAKSPKHEKEQSFLTKLFKRRTKSLPTKKNNVASMFDFHRKQKIMVESIV